jgi:hypothetical protein
MLGHTYQLGELWKLFKSHSSGHLQSCRPRLRLPNRHRRLSRSIVASAADGSVANISPNLSRNVEKSESSTPLGHGIPLLSSTTPNPIGEWTTVPTSTRPAANPYTGHMTCTTGLGEAEPQKASVRSVPLRRTPALIASLSCFATGFLCEKRQDGP